MARIRRGTIDLRGNAQFEQGGLDGVLFRELNKMDLDNSNFLYTGFNHDNALRVRKTGQYRTKGGGETASNEPDNIVFAYPRKELEWESEDGTEGIANYIGNFDNPGLIVYDGKQFRQGPENQLYTYTFIDPSKKIQAVKGIIRLLVD